MQAKKVHPQSLSSRFLLFSLFSPPGASGRLIGGLSSLPCLAVARRCRRRALLGDCAFLLLSSIFLPRCRSTCLLAASSLTSRISSSSSPPPPPSCSPSLLLHPAPPGPLSLSLLIPPHTLSSPRPSYCRNPFATSRCFNLLSFDLRLDSGSTLTDSQFMIRPCRARARRRAAGARSPAEAAHEGACGHPLDLQPFFPRCCANPADLPTA